MSRSKASRAGRKSRRKGKKGELELAHWLEARGVQARRGAQHRGGQDSPDVVAALDGVHLECKRAEELSVYASLEQAQEESGGRTPIVFHRRNKKPWVALLSAEDLLELLRAAGRVLGEIPSSRAPLAEGARDLFPNGVA